MLKRISSRANASFKALRALAASSRERRKQARTLLDGMHLVTAYAARCGLPEHLVVSEHGRRQAEIAAFLEAHPRANTLLLSDGLFAEISPVASPTGILAVIALPPPIGEGVAGGSCVLLDAIQDAGNLGSILRSAGAAGIAEVILGPGCADVWSPRVLRAAMGAHFGLRISERASLAELLAGFAGTSLATCVTGGCSLFETDLGGPIAWLFGNEGAGLAPDIASMASRAVFIPMAGQTESLNVAAAAAICLFEEARQKRAQQARADRSP